MKFPVLSTVFEVVLALLLLVGPTGTRGEESQKTDAHPVSAGVREKLQTLFEKHYPKAKFVDRGVNGIDFEDEITTFEFPYNGPQGAKHEAEKQQGPKKGGILCHVSSAEGRYRGPLGLHRAKGRNVAQRLIDRKEYKQLLMAPYSQGSGVHLWVALSYPPDVDETFLESFRQIMVDFEKAPGE